MTAAPVVSPLPEAQASEPGPRWRIAPAVGFGQALDTGLADTTPAVSVGASAAWSINEAMRLSFGLDGAFYRRTYLTTQPGSGGTGNVLTVDERRIGIDLLFSVDLLSMLKLGGGRHELAGIIGPQLRLFENGVLPSQFGALSLGARGALALSDQLDVWGSAIWGYSLFFANASLPSADGGPVQNTTLAGGLGLRLAPKTRITLGYGGELLTLSASYRFLHTAALAFEISF